MSLELHRRGDRSRRREIERQMVDAGLVRGPRRLRTTDELPSDLAAPTGRELARRLHNTLSRLGPVFASFGVYLSRRPDLLTTEECLELGKLMRAEPLQPEAVVPGRRRARG